MKPTSNHAAHDFSSASHNSVATEAASTSVSHAVADGAESNRRPNLLLGASRNGLAEDDSVSFGDVLNRSRIRRQNERGVGVVPMRSVEREQTSDEMSPLWSDQDRPRNAAALSRSDDSSTYDSDIVDTPYCPPWIMKRIEAERSNAVTTSLANVSLEHEKPANGSLGKAVRTTNCLGWQSTKATLKDRLSYMFCNEFLADIYLLVGANKEKIPAHKFILSTGSVVFCNMLNGHFLEHELGVQGDISAQEVELPDVEPEAMRTLLRFLYTDELNINAENVMCVFYAAKKYAVTTLEDECVKFLNMSLRPDNAFLLVSQARLFDESELVERCFEVIDVHTVDTLEAEGFLDIDFTTLSECLVRNTLRITEIQLFKAVVKWAKAQCEKNGEEPEGAKLREMLGGAINLIRFPLMTMEEFADCIVEFPNILTSDEAVQMFLFFSGKLTEVPNFSDRPRCCMIGKEVVVNRFQRIEGRWGYSGTPDRIKFSVDRHIYILGFGLHGSMHGSSEYQVLIEITSGATGEVMAQNDTSFKSDGSTNTFRVLFKEPVLILPNTTYIASACLQGPDSHYGTKGLRRIVHRSPTHGDVTFQFTYAAGNNNGTSVDDGQIPEIIFCVKRHA
uniref:BTB domain-containing protein n=1 Tax=Steinernema glaseri TaxID=37863 RepID=A0A1I7ZDB9_9BILA